MYSVITQCCPNRCLTICLSTVVTPTQVPLVLFTLQFFFHTLGLHTAPVARCPFHPYYMFIANLQCTFQALQHFFFFSKFFHKGFISRPVKKRQNLVGHGHGQGSTPVVHFVQRTFAPIVEFSRWLPHSLFLPGIPLPLLGLPLLLFYCKTCLILTMFRPSRQQRLSGQALTLR